MTLLVARTAKELPRSLAYFRDLGWSCSGLAISDTELSPPQPITTETLVVTSAQAAAYLGQIQPQIKRLYCVGEHSAKALEVLGYRPDWVGDEGGLALAHALLKQHPPHGVMHLAGDQAITDWHAPLQRAGFNVVLRQAYTTAYLHELPVDILAQARAGGWPFVLLFSVQGALQLQRLWQKNNLPWPRAVCLSAAVAEAWQGGGLSPILAAKPQLKEMAAALKKETQPDETTSPPHR